MERIRKPYQGITNIVRFNWHFYGISIGIISLILVINIVLITKVLLLINLLSLFVIVTVITSLLVSFYIYDLSALYTFKWLDKVQIKQGQNIVNINAGFDEISKILQAKFPGTNLKVFDFYDPEKHTEISIKRARKAYPPFAGTQVISTSNVPLQDNYADNIYLILAAHEIRDESERIKFFRELNRVLNPKGKIIITEHLRDLPNFLAYNIGFFHFLSKASWYQTFAKADLKISKQIKITPFISTYILEKNGTAS